MSKFDEEICDWAGDVIDGLEDALRVIESDENPHFKVGYVKGTIKRLIAERAAIVSAYGEELS